jgi:Glycosyl transferase family 11
MLHGADLVLDLGWFRHEARHFAAPRRFELGAFGLNVRTRVLRTGALAALEAGRRARFSSLRLAVIRQREGDHTVDERVLNASDDVVLVGYWQSEAYFADVSDTIRSELDSSALEIASRFERIVGGRSAVAVHFRRGDYVSSTATREFHGVLDLDYYRRAVAHVTERVPDPVFVAFSDEPDWVERELAPELPLTVMHGGDPLRDLQLMRRCTHHVIANSSFSWWGAWLGEQEESVVVAPERWFADPGVDSRSIVPERWQRL